MVLVAVLLGGSLASGAVSGTAYASPATGGPVTSAVERSLGAVSCVGRSFCLGVGPDQATEFGTPTFSQLWNGKAWLAPTAVPGPGGDDALLSVSCASSRNCVAVGGSLANGPLSDAWNGRTWRKLPVLDRPQAAILSGVDCPAANRCMAVGAAVSGAWAQLWNGKSWTNLKPLIPAGAINSQLTGVSCSGPANCVAVGQYAKKSGSSGVSLGLAESWNGSSWTLLPAPPSNLIGLGAVSCPTKSQCVVLGIAPSQSPPGSAVWNGSTWTSVPTPSASPKKTNQSLTSISCVSASDCFAVGSVPGPFGPGSVAGPTAEQWTGGSSWKLLRVPDPAAVSFANGGDQQEDYYLNSVSCTGPARCVAVGGDSFFQTLSSYSSFAVGWNGTAWNVLFGGQVDGLLGVSCYNVSRCLLTGTYLGRTDQTLAMTQRWHGNGVQVVARTGLRGVMSAVSCVSSSFCMAAGEGGAIDRFNGNRWTVSTPGIAGLEPDRIACVSRDFCMALGEFWNGKTWQASPLVPHRGDPQGFTILSGLSCISPVFCLAAGFWGDNRDSSIGGTLAELWNGKRWRIIASPGGPRTMFNAVSCVTATDCMVIGAAQENDDTGPVHLIAELWNGRTWHLTHPPGTFSPALWSGGGLGPSDISCPTANSCMAVGSHKRLDVALSWNGRTWRSIKVAGPGGLTLVSCAAPGNCLAIGKPGIRTLAKAWNGRTWRVIRTLNP
jgi:hypothetical protein